MKVNTLEERNNPKRNRRLRKKLHVAEFTEYVEHIYYKLKKDSPLNSDEKEDDILDYIIDVFGNKLGTACQMKSLVSIFLENPNDTTEELKKQMDKHFIHLVGYKDNAWYPDDTLWDYYEEQALQLSKQLDVS